MNEKSDVKPGKLDDLVRVLFTCVIWACVFFISVEKHGDVIKIDLVRLFFALTALGAEREMSKPNDKMRRGANDENEVKE